MTELAALGKLFRTVFISQIEPIWILNICYDFLAFHLFISQYLGRLKSFHLAWRGCALKWMERGRLDGVCRFFFFFVTNQITLFLLTEKKKELILKTMKKTRKNKVLCDWQLVSLGAGGSNSGPPCTNMPSTGGLSSRTPEAGTTSFGSLLLPGHVPTAMVFCWFPVNQAEAPLKSMMSFFFFSL